MCLCVVFLQCVCKLLKFSWMLVCVCCCGCRCAMCVWVAHASQCFVIIAIGFQNDDVASGHDSDVYFCMFVRLCWYVCVCVCVGLLVVVCIFWCVLLCLSIGVCVCVFVWEWVRSLASVP